MTNRTTVGAGKLIKASTGESISNLIIYIYIFFAFLMCLKCQNDKMGRGPSTAVFQTVAWLTDFAQLWHQRVEGSCRLSTFEII